MSGGAFRSDWPPVADEVTARRARERALARDHAGHDSPGRWALTGACGADDVDDELRDVFTADDVTGAQLRAAQDVCIECPAFVACGSWAEDVEPTAGVWAGVLYRDRRSPLHGMA